MPTLFPKLTKIWQRENGKFVDFNDPTKVSRRPMQQETPSNIYKRFILPETRVIDLHFCRWYYGCTFISFHVIMLQSRTIWV